MTTLRIEPQDTMDWENTQGLRVHNDLFNLKTTVHCQLQKFACSLCSRLDWPLDYKVSVQDQEVKHEYKLGDSVRVMFSTFGPLGRFSTTSGSPQSLKQFQAFLEKLGSSVQSPVNGAVTDMLRCMTVPNEKDFLIDAYNDDDHSYLELKSPSLRQVFQFTIDHV